MFTASHVILYRLSESEVLVEDSETESDEEQTEETLEVRNIMFLRTLFAFPVENRTTVRACVCACV